MSEGEDSLLDCAERELEEPHTPEGLETPRAILTVLLFVIAFLAVAGTCGRF